MSVINKIYFKLFCSQIGTDQFGNIYYISKTKNYLGQEKRFVSYKGINESSKVPPIWHAWLHYLSDEVPSQTNIKNHIWQKEHQPNLSGTKYAYNPALSKNVKIKTYSSWIPK
ncbi:MAG: NADH:ubiquinone oxidoreductase subunit NDUFA12 [Rickettsiales bacterium]|nr:MAG: NADH:ubiquinone oxidoreductase subunit NDUFA12 [Rickettsiales bacterium]